MPGIYIHIPFCKKKCAYCGFYSVPFLKSGGDYAERFDGYAKLLEREAELQSVAVKDTAFDTVYFGGGTPSLLGRENFERVFSALHKNFKIDGGAEITVEGNPSDFVDIKRLLFLRDEGVNRVSVGIQTMNGGTLKKIGRAQTPADNLAALRRVAEIFDNFSADIMLGLPGENGDDLERTLATVSSFGVKHISAYALKIEENTPLCAAAVAGRVNLPDDDTASGYYGLVLKELKKRGIERYEVSNFAKRGYRSRHNLNYWKRGEYLGLGAAAHSFMNGERFENPPDLDAYAAAVNAESRAAENTERPFAVSAGLLAAGNRRKISADDALFEKIMLGLRLSDGISVSETEKEFGINFREKYAAALKKLDRCFSFKGENIAVKGKYFYVLNSVLTEFL
ncbi:MAG: radical SAM family heme chaperone HemW [Clostridiales bacterium]|jgi:oxygen-independent coproporphyrinogen-3 oxidase|nr:radical SAM family heme chaperone HemW [Clostridiales bacterium]